VVTACIAQFKRRAHPQALVPAAAMGRIVSASIARERVAIMGVSPSGSDTSTSLACRGCRFAMHRDIRACGAGGFFRCALFPDAMSYRDYRSVFFTQRIFKSVQSCFDQATDGAATIGNASEEGVQ
jgi:hypothetical protein